MKYNILGRTGLKVSVIGMGGIPLQRVDCSEAEKIVAAARQKGINFFDTARGYSNSEKKMGLGFARHGEGAIVATKSMERSYDEIIRDVNISLANLGVESIHLYQLHNIKTEETLRKVMAPDGAVAGLREMQKQGKVKFIGITGHISDIMIKAIRTGEFDTVQVPFNVIETDPLQELIPLAREMNVGTICMKPLAGGALSQYSEAALKYILQYPKEILQQEASRLGNRFCRRCEYCQPCPNGVNIPVILLLDNYWTRYGLKEWARERYAALGKGISDCVQCGECEEKCPYDLPIIDILQQAATRLE